MVPLILGAVWTFIYTTAMAFWPWIVTGVGAILAFLFSPTVRKYTVAILAVAAILVITWLNGYSSNHTIQTVTHQCTEFRKVLVTGPATDKAINLFNRKGLCE